MRNKLVVVLSSSPYAVIMDEVIDVFLHKYRSSLQLSMCRGVQDMYILYRMHLSVITFTISHLCMGSVTLPAL